MPGIRQGRRRAAAFLAAALAAATMLAACGSAREAPAAPSSAIRVVAAENMYGDVAAQVCGSRCAVTSIMSDPNADPHEFSANVGDAAAVAGARLVIENGAGYDAFLDHLLSASPNPSRTVINVQELTGHTVGDNPHIWYAPAVMPAVAGAIAKALAVIDPAHATAYAAGAQRFDASLRPLRAEIAKIRSTHPSAPVAYTEPVFGYMGQALGFRVLTPETFQQAVEDGRDPSVADLVALQQQLAGHRVRVLIYNLQVASPVTARIVDEAKADGIPVVGVTETEPARTTFQQWQLDQLQQIERALARGRP